MSDAAWIEIIGLMILLIVVASLIAASARLHNLTRDLKSATLAAAKQADRMEATVDRMETASQVVATNLAGTVSALEKAADQRLTQGEAIDRMEAATFVVADNLASSVGRADATQGSPGEAADAALRTGDTAEAIHKRQDDARG